MKKTELAEIILNKIFEYRDLKRMNYYLPIMEQLNGLKDKSLGIKDLHIIKYRKASDEYRNYYFVVGQIKEKNEKYLIAETYLGERKYKDYEIIELGLA